MNKFKFFNDTGRVVRIHPATLLHGVQLSALQDIDEDHDEIKPLEVKVFYLPKDTYPMVKMWDYGDRGGGLSIFVSPQKE